MVIIRRGSKGFNCVTGAVHYMYCCIVNSVTSQVMSIFNFVIEATFYPGGKKVPVSKSMTSRLLCSSFFTYGKHPKTHVTQTAAIPKIVDFWT